MSEYGVNQKGFNKKTREEISKDMEILAKNLFGDEINLADNSPLGKFIKLNAFEMNRLWDLAEGIYNATFLNTATGQALDNIANYLGIKRKEATAARGKVIFSGEAGTLIKPDTLLETDEENPVQFKTINQEDVVLINSTSSPNLGEAEVPIRAITKGANTNVDAHTITQITNPLPGIDSVTNPKATAGGQEEETDFELRERYKASVAAPGGSTIAAIKSNVLKVDGVRACLVEENDTFDFDKYGRPPKSFETIVLDGVDEDIAQAIFERKPAGIQAYGQETVEIYDDANNPHLVNFSRAEEAHIYVKLELTVDETKYPEDGDKLVKDAIISYIGGKNSKEELALGLSLGQEVIYSKLFDVIYSVSGIKDVKFSLAKSNQKIESDQLEFKAENLTIKSNQVATTSLDKIEISKVE
jgi:uncharacterized phage protein gp47/JayE